MASLNDAELATFFGVEAECVLVCLRASQNGRIKDGTAEVGTAQICAAEISLAQVRTLQRGPAETSPG